MEYCFFYYNIGINDTSAINLFSTDKAINDIGLTHIRKRNSEFNHNGSILDAGVINIKFDTGADLYSIMLEGNIFKNNTSQSDKPVI